MHDFPAILTHHGFTRDNYEFESTIIGFDYDIQFALFNTDTIFDLERSQLFRQWDDASAYIRAELVSISGNIDAAIRFFYDRWVTELRYNNTVREIIELQRTSDSASIHVLIISQHNAMSLLFNIR